MGQQGPGGFSHRDEKDLTAMKGPPRAWRYSMAFGVMYGNIPVGIIAVGLCFIVWLRRKIQNHRGCTRSADRVLEWKAHTLKSGPMAA